MRPSPAEQPRWRETRPGGGDRRGFVWDVHTPEAVPGAGEWERGGAGPSRAEISGHVTLPGAGEGPQVSGGARSSARGGRGARQHVGQQKGLVRAVQVRAATEAGGAGAGGTASPLRISTPGHRPAPLPKRDPGLVALGWGRN